MTTFVLARTGVIAGLSRGRVRECVPPAVIDQSFLLSRKHGLRHVLQQTLWDQLNENIIHQLHG